MLQYWRGSKPIDLHFEPSPGLQEQLARCQHHRQPIHLVFESSVAFWMVRTFPASRLRDNYSGTAACSRKRSTWAARSWLDHPTSLAARIETCALIVLFCYKILVPWFQIMFLPAVATASKAPVVVLIQSMLRQKLTRVKHL